MEEAREHLERALAIHRETGNRRFEGAVLAELCRLHDEQGRMEEAATAFDASERLLRDAGDRLELEKLRCIAHRGEFERRLSDLAAAREAPGEAEALAAAVGAGPDAELGRLLTLLRASLGSGAPG